MAGLMNIVSRIAGGATGRRSPVAGGARPGAGHGSGRPVGGAGAAGGGGLLRKVFRRL